MNVDMQNVGTHKTGLALFFAAQSIAVIGASNHQQKVGYQVLNNLVKAARPRNPSEGIHPRKLYPVNPTAQSILGLKCYPSITEISDSIELVIIVTPVGTVLDIVEEVIERNRLLSSEQKVKAVIIISAGFAEIDREGKVLQQLVATQLKQADIRLLGPNTLGLIHTGKKLNASFAQLHIPEGNLAVISQSGAMLTALFNSLVSQQAGISFAVSLGNKADLNENDCLEYALTDSQTAAVIMYIESFSELPRFFELVTQLRRQKPVIILKGGMSTRGQVASSSHTAALATNQTLLQAAADQFGFTLVENMEELMNVAFFLAHHHHLPSNTMVITNAGGPAVNTIDELTHAGVEIAQWSKPAQANITELLPHRKPVNPLDLLGDADPLQFKQAIQVAQRDPNIESMVVIITPQAVTDVAGIVEQIIDIQGKKPLFVALMGGDQLEHQRNILRQHQVFCTSYPNDIVEMLHVLAQAAKKSFLPYQYVLSPAHNLAESDQHSRLQSVHRQLATQQGIHQSLQIQPNLEETFGLLAKAGFTLPKYWVIRKDTLKELEELSYPLFAKTANLSLLHKKKLGAVYGVVHSAEEAKQAYQKMSAFGNEVLFQQVIEIEDELLVGVENDPQFGLYLTVGLGGSYTNLLADRAYCFLPAPISIIEKVWKQTKAAQLFADNTHLTQQILIELQRIQQFVMQHPWIRSIEINPLAVSQGKLWVADIKLQV